MFNIGAPELLVIMVVALIVLGPTKLPEAARKMGHALGELRRLSTGFQSELRNALDEPLDATATRREVVQGTGGDAGTARRALERDAAKTRANTEARLTPKPGEARAVDEVAVDEVAVDEVAVDEVAVAVDALVVDDTPVEEAFDDDADGEPTA